MATLNTEVDFYFHAFWTDNLRTRSYWARSNRPIPLAKLRPLCLELKEYAFPQSHKDVQLDFLRVNEIDQSHEGLPSLFFIQSILTRVNTFFLYISMCQKSKRDSHISVA